MVDERESEREMNRLGAENLSAPKSEQKCFFNQIHSLLVKDFSVLCMTAYVNRSYNLNLPTLVSHPVRIELNTPQ